MSNSSTSITDGVDLLVFAVSADQPDLADFVEPALLSEHPFGEKVLLIYLPFVEFVHEIRNFSPVWFRICCQNRCILTKFYSLQVHLILLEIATVAVYLG